MRFVKGQVSGGYLRLGWSNVGLVPMPLVEQPFGCIAMDFVGPLPRTKRGNRYILVICDYATRYPEAIPLPTTKAARVAKELVKLFAHFRIPQEILTDQGANFMSGLLEEVYSSLHIRRIRTSPYHPQTDGLVERFNGTLKAMLKKFNNTRGSDWDEYLPYLLFAYREVPQESTGFSPFELLYGRKVRGPLDVLREEWTGEHRSTQSVGQHLMDIQKRLAEMSILVTDNMQQAQAKQKTYYDQRAKIRKFEGGDEVLVLLSRAGNPLKLEWAGPYRIIRQISPVNYIVETPGRRRETKTVHINLMKKWYSTPTSSLFAVELHVLNDDLHHFREEDLLVPVPDSSSEDASNFVISQRLSISQRNELFLLTERFPGLFSSSPGRTSVVEHRIYVKGATPVKQKPYRVPYSQRDQVQQELRTMLESGIIRESVSPWASPMVIVSKKDGSLRLCVDYDAYPMPRVEEVFDSIGSASYITTLDLAKGYWQIPMAADSCEVTAFITPFGLFEFLVMPFGLHTAPATFQRLMNSLLREFQEFAGAYLDDVVIFSCSWEDHLAHLSRVFACLHAAGLTVKPSKCSFGFEKTLYLGHIIGGGNICPDPEKVESVINYRRPSTKRDVRAFLGLIGYYRKFLKDFSGTAAPLIALTKKGQPDRVKWDKQCEDTFQILKHQIVSTPVLRVAYPSKPFLLQTDASDLGLGAVLSQEHEGSEHPVAFASRKLSPAEKKYSVIEKECLALVWGIKHFHVYLFGKKFKVQTDHQPLHWLHQMQNSNNRLTHWALSLQPYHFELHYRAGSQNGNADALSRQSDVISGVGNDPPPST